MHYHNIIKELSTNRDVFRALLQNRSEAEFLWKPAPEKWCLLEIVCHLFDEERDDFRARTRHVLETPEEPMPSIDPEGWVKERKYMQRNYNAMLKKFLAEREESVRWLQSLTDPKWENLHRHPGLGDMTARMFLCNWLAHDYLHFRQIVKLKYDYTREITRESLDYAGTWKQ